MKKLTNVRAAVLSAIFALGLAPFSQALQEGAAPTGKKPAAQKEAPASKSPVKRKVRFESKQAVTVKQRLEIYNRVKAKEQLHCRKDTVTGSHRKAVRCVTQATRQLEEDAARLFFDSLGRPGLR